MKSSSDVNIKNSSKVSDEKIIKQSRAEIIQTVQTPLGFFVLVVLVVEVIFGLTANFSQGNDRTYLIIGMLALIFLLVGIVVFLACFRPEALKGKRPTESKADFDLPSSVPKVERVEKPSILCACAALPLAQQWEFKHDVATINKMFPGQVAVENNVNADRLRELLTSRDFHIVHILGYVESNDGTLLLDKDDRMSTEGFAKLLEVCKARLVILATCDSITLAAKVSRTSNIIAATSVMEVRDFVDWEKVFYRMLAQGHSLSRAYEIARATTNAPMVLLMKQDFTLA